MQQTEKDMSILIVVDLVYYIVAGVGLLEQLQAKQHYIIVLN